MNPEQHERLTVNVFMEEAGFESNFLGNHWRDAPRKRPIQDHVRMVAKYASPLWEARLYAATYNNVAVWRSPPFEDPISAFVYAQTANWGQ